MNGGGEVDSNGWIVVGGILCGSGVLLFITAQIILSKWIKQF